MPRIFVSYRRKDSAGHAGRLFDRLREHFGANRVFRDVDQLKPGDDFVDTLARAVDSCDVFVLVIGRDPAGGDALARRFLDMADHPTYDTPSTPAPPAADTHEEHA